MELPPFKPHDLQFQCFNIFRFAFPNYQDSPTLFFQGPIIFPVSLNIPKELLIPEFHIAGRSRRSLAPQMLMPKTPMNKDARTVFRQNNIRFAGQVFPMEAEPKAKGMKHPPNHKLRPSILAVYGRHNTRSVRWRKLIHKA